MLKLDCYRCGELTTDCECPKCPCGLPRGHFEVCRFVECDNEDCRAIKDPKTIDELRDAYEHWRYHSCSHGCSHGG